MDKGSTARDGKSAEYLCERSSYSIRGVDQRDENDYWRANASEECSGKALCFFVPKNAYIILNIYYIKIENLFLVL
jgi:hypothetical protein